MDYFIGKDGSQHGPYSEDQVKSLLQEGQVTWSDLFWHEGLTEWLPLSGWLTAPATQNSGPAMPAVASSRGPAKVIPFGYACALLSLVVLPLGFGIAGLVLGIMALTRGRTGHGVAIIVFSVTSAFLGALFASM